jgi:hypothetical protein
VAAWPLCPGDLRPTGLPAGQNGGFQDVCRCDADFTYKLPEGLSSADAAPLLCAGVTVYAPIKRMIKRPGAKIAVLGIGGLGHLGLQFAAAMGAEVGRASMQNYGWPCLAAPSAGHLALQHPALQQVGRSACAFTSRQRAFGRCVSGTDVATTPHIQSYAGRRLRWQSEGVTAHDAPIRVLVSSALNAAPNDARIVIPTPHRTCAHACIVTPLMPCHI